MSATMGRHAASQGNTARSSELDRWMVVAVAASGVAALYSRTTLALLRGSASCPPQTPPVLSPAAAAAVLALVVAVLALAARGGGSNLW
mmetsp:Transcript_11319/g.35794  ORF Transcript_11319/g.35794 Transcript_11319/m.35794 type:complete len:89 (-) Transcript_11319:1868-2134(-)